MRRVRVVLLALVASLAGVIWCQAAMAGEALVVALRDQVRSNGPTAGRSGEIAQAIATWYEERNFTAQWLDNDRVGTRGQSLLVAVRAAGSHGLDPGQYGLAEIEAASRSASDVDRARLDWLLTRALLLLATDLAGGRINPSTFDYNVQVEPRRLDVGRMLRDGTAAPDPAVWLEGQAPQTPAYATLRRALDSYRQKMTAPHTRVPDSATLLRPGQRDTRVPLLRQRLSEIEGLEVPPAPEDAQLYDEPLAAVVKVYQGRLGLSVDGIIGARTIESLNASSTDRVSQIVANLERRRWQDDVPGRRYVKVNIADHSMMFVDDAKVVFASRVIVGTPKDQTPELSSTMRSFQTNPYWTVPTSIAGEEYLPMLRRDPQALQKQGMRIFASWSDDGSEIDPAAIDWSQVQSRAFPYRIRQDPGAGNALGYIFFPFQNKYGIYMHDTASRWLFSEGSRNFSHGCIRLQNPLDFVEAVFKNRNGVTKERVTAAIQSQAQQNYVFPEPVPLHIVYQTVTVKSDGSLEFRDDVYGRDRRLVAAMATKR